MEDNSVAAAADNAPPAILTEDQGATDESNSERSFREAANRLEAAPEDLFRNDFDPLASTPDLQIGAYSDGPATGEHDELPSTPSAFEDEPPPLATEVNETGLDTDEGSIFDERDTIPRAPLKVAELAQGPHSQPPPQPAPILEPTAVLDVSSPDDFELEDETLDQETESKSAAKENFDSATTAPMAIVYPDPEDHEIIVQPPAKKRRLLLVAIPLLLVALVFLLYQYGFLSLPSQKSEPKPAIAATETAEPASEQGSESESGSLAGTVPPEETEQTKDEAAEPLHESNTLVETSPEDTTPPQQVTTQPASVTTAATIPDALPEDPAEPLPANTTDSGTETLAQASVERFRIGGKPFSIAIMLACEEETVTNFVAANPGEDIYVFQRDYNGRSCFDLTWGSFSSWAEANRNIDTVPAKIKSVGTPWIKKFPQFL